MLGIYPGRVRDVNSERHGLGDALELGYMDWYNLVSSSSPSPFTNIQPSDYRSDTEYGRNPSDAWRFSNGGQNTAPKAGTSNWAWPVAPGDELNAIPVPSAAFLFPSACGVLAWARRKRAAA